MRDLSKMTCIEDLRRVAKFKMPKMFYDYIDSGSWTQTTYRANTADFIPIQFRQKVLVDMEGRSLAAKMIGQDVKMPLAIAPTGFTGMAWAMGARGFMTGRAFLYGLGAYGEDGVRRALEIMYNEMDITMAFTGHRNLHDVDKNILVEGTYPQPAR